ncbi:MAG TPA: TetR/AcrR family transcriptional regulator [Thermoanaerobaculia bacterium]|nr:TetR/AcrR family transcriptional regulator [Thermoanaerobaculia bacterium]
MGPKERREREREEIRTRILDAARELFADEGVESVTMRRIADRIEYSPTAIYFHFKDKEALLAELCDTDFRAFAHGFAAIATIPDPVERLRAAGGAYVHFGLTNPSHYRLMFMTPKTTEASTIAKGNPDEDAYAFLKGIVAELTATGRFRDDLTDAVLTAQVIWSAIHGVVSLEIAKCKDEWVEWRPVEARTQVVIDMILLGLLRTEGNGSIAGASSPSSSLGPRPSALGPQE